MIFFYWKMFFKLILAFECDSEAWGNFETRMFQQKWTRTTDANRHPTLTCAPPLLFLHEIKHASNTNLITVTQKAGRAVFWGKQTHKTAGLVAQHFYWTREFHTRPEYISAVFFWKKHWEKVYLKIEIWWMLQYSTESKDTCIYQLKLKPVDTIGNCQRPVFLLAVS